MVDGEALVMTMAMISSESPSRQGARTELLIPVLGFSVAAERGCVSRKNDGLPDVFRSEGISSRKGGVGGRPRWPHQPWVWAHLCRAGPWRGGLVRRLRPPFWLRGSSGKIGCLRLFPGIFSKVDFLHKNKTPG